MWLRPLPRREGVTSAIMSSVNLNAFDFIDDNNQHFIDEKIQSTIDDALLMNKNRKDATRKRWRRRGKDGRRGGKLTVQQIQTSKIWVRYFQSRDTSPVSGASPGFQKKSGTASRRIDIEGCIFHK